MSDLALSIFINWLPLAILFAVIGFGVYLLIKLIKRIDRALPDSNRKH